MRGDGISCPTGDIIRERVRALRQREGGEGCDVDMGGSGSCLIITTEVSVTVVVGWGWGGLPPALLRSMTEDDGDDDFLEFVAAARQGEKTDVPVPLASLDQMFGRKDNVVISVFRKDLFGGEVTRVLPEHVLTETPPWHQEHPRVLNKSRDPHRGGKK